MGEIFCVTKILKKRKAQSRFYSKSTETELTKGMNNSEARGTLNMSWGNLESWVIRV